MQQLIRNSLIHFMVASDPRYLPTPLHKYLCNLVQDRIQKGNARLCISIPPRHGKSKIVSEGLPAWFMGHNPAAEVMEICHSADLATEFGGRVRSLMSTAFYSALFPGSAPSGEGRAGSKWSTVGGGLYKGEGVDGSFTGFGAHLLVVDDIVKNRKTAHSPTFQKAIRDTFGSTIFTRLLPNSNIVILNTRWTANDLIAYTAGELGWEYINLPAIALENDPLGREPGQALCPERYPLEALLEIKSTMNPYDWEALYQGIPPDEVKSKSFPVTEVGVMPKVGVWYDDRVLLFADQACTHIGGAETLTDLQQYLEAIEQLGKIPIYCCESGVANHPHTRAVVPTLCHHPRLDGYAPDVSLIGMSFPRCAVTPRDIDAARYYLTLPKVQEYRPGRLGLGGILAQR